MNARLFETLESYFDRVDLGAGGPGGSNKRTDVGEFVPSPLRQVHEAFGYLLTRGAIDGSGLFLDAGSGDARVVALVALVHGIPSVGVEYDEDLVERSARHLRDLQHLLPDGAPMTILPGDFTEDDTYLRAGMSFSGFTTVFNFINNTTSLAAKVSRQSLPGTKLLLFRAFPVTDFWGLTLEQNLEMLTWTDAAAGGAIVENRPFTEESFIDLQSTYMQVYRR
jgi:hypothetical protein